MINSYADAKVAKNTPPRQFSIYRDWVNVTKHELYKFLCVLIAMGLDKKPSVKDYWSLLPHNKCNFYHDMFSRTRFEAIYHTMLHVSNVDSLGKEKIEPFVNMVLERFQMAYYPYQNLSIDEMVIGYKGRWQYKQYNASKPSKYHIKTFGLCCSATGYVYN